MSAATEPETNGIGKLDAYRSHTSIVSRTLRVFVECRRVGAEEARLARARPRAIIRRKLGTKRANPREIPRVTTRRQVRKGSFIRGPRHRNGPQRSNNNGEATMAKQASFGPPIKLQTPISGSIHKLTRAITVGRGGQRVITE